MWTSPPSSSNSSYARIGNDSNNGNSTMLMPKSMEEIWKDITLSSLQHYDNPRGMILQDFFGKDPPPDSAVDASPPAPVPPTLLTLNSRQEVQSSSGTLGLPHHGHVLDPGHGKKRLPDFERSSGDRRHKRMIKNRESAARSRARKQAYTNELELEVAHLLEENARLKNQQVEQIIMDIPKRRASKGHLPHHSELPKGKNGMKKLVGF